MISPGIKNIAQKRDFEPGDQSQDILNTAFIPPSAAALRAEISNEQVKLNSSETVPTGRLELHTKVYEKSALGEEKLVHKEVAVLARYHRTIYKSQTVERASRVLAALEASGLDCAVTLYSKKGKPLITLESENRQIGANEDTKLKVDVFSAQTPSDDIIKQLVKSDARQVVVQHKEQLSEVLRVAERLKIEKILAPSALLKERALQPLISSGLLSALPENPNTRSAVSVIKQAHAAETSQEMPIPPLTLKEKMICTKIEASIEREMQSLESRNEALRTTLLDNFRAARHIMQTLVETGPLTTESAVQKISQSKDEFTKKRLARLADKTYSSAA